MLEHPEQSPGYATEYKHYKHENYALMQYRVVYPISIYSLHDIFVIYYELWYLSISTHIVRAGHLEVVKYLIEVQGCSAECTDVFGRTPLRLACG